jgi:hypothetical protein
MLSDFMNYTALLYALGSAPLFAARPFLAAFITALIARYGTNLPLLGDSEAVLALSGAPAWFTSATCLWTLFALAAAEVASAKSPEVRALLDEFDGVIKSGVAFLVSLAILDPKDAALIQAIDQNSILGFSSLGAALTSGTVYGCNLVRRGLVGMLNEIDDHDDVGLQSLLAWIENTWTVFGILLLLLLPLFALLLSALATLGLFLWRRRALAREQAALVACASCTTRIRPSATLCYSCKTPVASPRAVGVFGQPLNKPAKELALHRFELAARKRCPDCATRLEKRAVRQNCPLCNKLTFASRAEFESYLAVLSARLPKTLLICAGLSAIPLLGIIPGVIYYRLTLVSGLRGFIPPLTGCSTRLLVRVLNYGIIALQPIPILGALILPLMCWSNYTLYRRALNEKAHEQLVDAEVAAVN